MRLRRPSITLPAGRPRALLCLGGHDWTGWAKVRHSPWLFSHERRCFRCGSPDVRWEVER